MKTQESEKSHQVSDSKPAVKPILDSQKQEKGHLNASRHTEAKHGVTETQPEKNPNSLQTKKVSDTPAKSEDTETKEKATPAPAWQKAATTEKPKAK